MQGVHVFGFCWLFSTNPMAAELRDDARLLTVEVVMDTVLGHTHKHVHSADNKGTKVRQSLVNCPLWTLSTHGTDLVIHAHILPFELGTQPIPGIAG